MKRLAVGLLVAAVAVVVLVLLVLDRRGSADLPQDPAGVVTPERFARLEAMVERLAVHRPAAPLLGAGGDQRAAAEPARAAASSAAGGS